MDLLNYENNCRLCLKAPIGVMKNVFTHKLDGYEQPLAQIIFTLLNIKLNPHRRFSESICRKCLTEIENIILFKEDVQRNQEFLCNLFNNSSPDPKIQESHLQNIEANNIENHIYIDNQSKSSWTNPNYLKVPSKFLNQISPVVQTKCLENYTSLRNVFTKQNADFPSKTKSIRIKECKFCNKVFRYAVQLQMHYKKEHKYQQPIKTIQEDTYNIIVQSPNGSNNTILDTKEDKPEVIGKGASLKIEATIPTPNTSKKLQDQVNFLINFNLIPKDDAQARKFKQHLTNLVYLQTKRQSDHNGAKTTKATAKDKTKTANKSNANNKVLKRSISFLTRYGFRNSGCNKRLRQKLTSVISLHENRKKPPQAVKVPPVKFKVEPLDNYTEAVPEIDCDNLKVEFTNTENCKLEDNISIDDSDCTESTELYPSAIKTELKPDFEEHVIKTSPETPKKRGRKPKTCKQAPNEHLNKQMEFGVYKLRRFCCDTGKDANSSRGFEKKGNSICQCSGMLSLPNKDAVRKGSRRKSIKTENILDPILDSLTPKEHHSQSQHFSFKLNDTNELLEKQKISPEKIVNLDVEDVEIQMLVYNCENKRFGNKGIITHIKGTPLGDIPNTQSSNSERVKVHSQNTSKSSRKSIRMNVAKYTLRSRSEGSLNLHK
ncbi:hypothetical protein GWI33_018534 [Rhynchophorus ferrugineus]|uniref:ZAD domain-containing protein n=1 Tax=Rhynchophorus ferrugineus TaxID=354439 RepID=A0A834HW50_RHYFE|nr:hypothetical protein GWI33_018534 [Rhynchophorus ferrugineus]